MNAKELAQKFPAKYRNEIQEMIENRIEINRLRELAGKSIRMTAGEYAEDVLIAEYGFDQEYTGMTAKAQMQSINETLEASRRVLARTSK